MKRLLAITAVLVLAIGVAAWANPFPDITVFAIGNGNATITQMLTTEQGSLFETVTFDGAFGLFEDLYVFDGYFVDGFVQDSCILIDGSIDLFKLVTVDQEFYTMAAFVDIEATGCLLITESVGVLEWPCWACCYACDDAYVGTDLWLNLDVYGCVEEGTFGAGHYGTATWQGAYPWWVEQSFVFDLWSWSSWVYVYQGGTIYADVSYEFDVFADVENDWVSLHVDIYDYAW